MTILLAATAALGLALARDVSVLRPVNPASGAPRFVRLELDVTAYGVRGRGEIVVDRARRRYVQRTFAGPVSEAEGFDGTRAWRADATGMGRIEGNADERGAILAWSYVLAGAPRAARSTRLAVAPPDRAVRVQYPALSRGVDVVFGSRSGLVARVVRRAGDAAEITSFDDYRTVGAVVVPFAFDDVSDAGSVTARVRSVDTPRAVPDALFAPPGEPHDFTLARLTTLPMLHGRGIVVHVRVNGTPLVFGVDTGGQNVISHAAARRAGLAIAGTAAASGVGAGHTAAQFATARSVRIGAAEMRDQPFVVLDLPAAVDGLVGYELLARFAARADFVRRRFDLAPRASAFGRGGVVVPFAFKDKQPQVDGAIDGIPGVLTIDTGSNGWVDVKTPFVRRHRLVERYHARVSGMAFAGVGGAVRASYAMAGTLRIGGATLHHVLLRLADAKGGVEIDPSAAANVGDEVLRRFVVVFDYRGGVMRLLPGGDPVQRRWRDRSGLRIVPDGTRLRVTDVLTATPASAAGIRAGMVLTALGGRAVTSGDERRVIDALDGAPGTVLRLTFEDGRSVALRLREYFPR